MPGDADTVIGFVDVPGHERLIRNMLAGSAGIDLMLLAVAADDGVMPQTREHLVILDLLGIERGMVALTKIDMAEADQIAAVHSQIANLLLGTGLEGAEIILVSLTTGEGIEELRDMLMLEAAFSSAGFSRLPRRGPDGRAGGAGRSLGAADEPRVAP